MMQSEPLKWSKGALQAGNWHRISCTDIHGNIIKTHNNFFLPTPISATQVICSV